jgi:hypothetical protein
MTLRFLMALIIAASLSGVSACSAEHHTEEEVQSQAETASQSHGVTESTATGTVVETMNAGTYTYVLVDANGTEIWAAATRFDVAVGDNVVVPLEMPMQDFYSESLDRTFPVVYFTSQILMEGQAGSPAMPPGHPAVGGPMASSHETANEIAAIDPIDGGVTVDRIWTETADLAGTSVTVRGQVVKFNGGILGTNWIHLQDGTGSASDGTHDLTVTTSADVSVGDVITVTGTLVTDQDFGAGYTYEVLLQDAELIAD